VENDAVVHGGGFDDLAVPHLELPEIGVVVRLAVARGGFAVEEDDDDVAIGADAAHFWLEAAAEARVHRLHHPANEGLSPLIGFGSDRSALDGPQRIVGEQIERAAGAVRPGLEAVADELLVLLCAGDCVTHIARSVACLKSMPRSVNAKA